MPTPLQADDDLRRAASTAQERFKAEPEYQVWIQELESHLLAVRQASPAEFRSESFQQALWNGEAVSATGQGQIDVSRVIHDPVTLDLLEEFRVTALPNSPEERTAVLLAMWTRLLEHIKPHVTRVPRLKLFRVFAALFPEDFTSVADLKKLHALARALGLRPPSGRPGVEVHREIVDRLTAVLGVAAPPPTREGVERMALPWLIYAVHVQEQGDTATETVTAVPGKESLKPLPADRRRKGLTAIGGNLPAIRNMIEFARGGCTREDFKQHIRSVNPNLGESAVGTNINALMAEWGVLRADGDQLMLTPRGEAFLESADPGDLADWLLTRILGFDHVLVEIDRKPISTPALIAHLKLVNPGWTHPFAPSVLISWAKWMGLAELGSDSLLRLTGDGQVWRRRITWSPEFLTPPQIRLATAAETGGSDKAASSRVTVPPFDRLLQAMPPDVTFPSQLVARLHAGLWSHHRRHFGVLAGLSGAGKTLLARSYALALRHGETEPAEGLLTLPVQPGWHDPSHLLGYVNPLSSGTYVRTSFLDFLLRATGDPGRPYTVVLDEMNLSHPEQYFAPLLSAMETGEPLRFHTEEDELSGVPPEVPYPANLLIIGTVNMDETTHGLSDKVLDRACVVDFWDIQVSDFPGWKTAGLEAETAAKTRDLLQALVLHLTPVRLHFGWRTIEDILGYLRVAASTAHLEMNVALDHAIHGKVLTKLRGEDTPRLRQALERTLEVLNSHGMKVSAKKVGELIDDLAYSGHARYWR